MLPRPPISTLFPYTTLFRSVQTVAFFTRTAGAAFRWAAPKETAIKTVKKILVVVFIAHVVLIRSEEHTSELQSHSDLVCRLLLEKKNPLQPRLLPRHRGRRP